MTEAYPLYWPKNRPRTLQVKRTYSRFKTTFGAAVRKVVGELRNLGARYPVISTNVPLRNDGLPYASCKKVDDPGVAVYFEYKGKQTCFACDRWLSVEENIYAIAQTINAMRGIARWGTGDMLDAAFSGFSALPAPETWRDALGNPKNLLEAESNYRAAARNAHPDAGGSHEEMTRLNNAIEQARKELL